MALCENAVAKLSAETASRYIFFIIRCFNDKEDLLATPFIICGHGFRPRLLHDFLLHRLNGMEMMNGLRMNGYFRK